MKFLLILTLSTLLLLFSGCSDANDSDSDNISAQTDIENELSGNTDGGSQDASVNGDVLADIGKTVEEIADLHGEITVCEWVNGPVYSYENSGIWYAFSEYEITDSGYEPHGKCSCIILPVYELIDTPDGEYDTDTLVDLSDTTVSRGYDDMDSMYYYEMTVGNYSITVYTDQSGDVSDDSSARVSKIKED